jgi:stearoyl-CoA desaturase (delta-9 desaturase)
MTALVASLTSLPYTQFRKSRHFYLWYDGFFALSCIAAIAWMRTVGWQGLTQAWDWRLLFLLPVACHIQILCSVWIHNCTHNNFPRAVNRLVGEICGFVVLTRFASWEIIHQRHHKYSDDPELDPHPILPGFTGYWKFTWRSVVAVEQQLQRMYFEMYGGETPENVRYQRYRAVLSFGTMVLCATTWFLILGAPVFVLLFVPASLVGFFHLMHFNWSTHNPWSKTADFRPVNIDSGFYKIGNWLWHGIYFHGNHHEKTNLFNPGKMDPEKALPIIRPGDATDNYPRKKTKGRAR